MNMRNFFISPLFGASLVFAAGGAQAGTYDANNVTKNQLITGVYSITTQQTGEIPVVRVQSDGNSYTAIKPGQSIKYQGTSRGVCRSLRKIRKFHWWINDNSQTGPNSYYQHHVKLAEKIWLNSKHSDDKYEVAGSMSLQVPNKVAQDAVKACNNYLDSQLGQGKTKAQALANDHIVPAMLHNDDRLAAVTYMQCSNDAGMNTMLAHAWQNIKINYLCEAADVPAPPTPSIGKLDMPFMLDKPLVSVTPSNYTGSCPVDLEVEGTLKGNKGQQAVKYRWSHNGGLSPVYNTVLNTNGWKTVKTTLEDIGKAQGGINNIGFQQQQQQGNQQLNLNANPSNVHTGYVELKALPGGENDWSKAKTSLKANYRVTCQEPKKGRLVLPSPGGNPEVDGVDLLPGPQLTINMQSANWGSTLNVDASNAGPKQQGRCPLRMAYGVHNQGNADAGAFRSRLYEGNKTLHQANINALAGGADKKVAGIIYLNNGTHHIEVFVDNQQQVGETDENNNKERITVKVRNCDQQTPSSNNPQPRSSSAPFPSTINPQPQKPQPLPAVQKVRPAASKTEAPTQPQTPTSVAPAPRKGVEPDEIDSRAR